MLKDSIYLSVPVVKLADKLFDNSQIIEKVHQLFKGNSSEWKKIKTGISFIFRYCDTKERFLGLELNKKPVDYAVDVARDVCKTNNILPEDIDLLIYGGIYRDYFEPATSMEIASKLGAKSISAFDVTNACAGMMQSVQVAYSLMQTNKQMEYALICSSDFPGEAINYDIQSFDELETKSAGLTLGGGAAAWLLSRNVLKQGGARLLSIKNTSIPSAYDICKVPVKQKKFHSLSKEIFDLGIHYVPNEIKAIAKKVNWEIKDIDIFLAHQPSKKIIQDICDMVGVPRERAPLVHHLFGNTVN